MTANAAQVFVSNYTQRDKYGRNVNHNVVNGHVVAVRVTLPKAYREQYGKAYLVNDWAATAAGGDHTASVTEVATLKEARALEAAIVAREVDKARKG
jgi:hypothetical protein